MFATNDLFKGKGFGLNGIVHHKDGYLLIVKMDDGTLLKVDEKDPRRSRSSPRTRCRTATAWCWSATRWP